MNKYFITHFDVKGLWGNKNYPLRFHEDVNVIIGPNASGKTTLINILFDVFTANFSRLVRTTFAEVTIKLRAFEGSDRCEIQLKHTKDHLLIQIDDQKYPLPLAPFLHFGDDPVFAGMPPEVARRRFRFEIDFAELQKRLKSLVPAVWLPVSRRLPIAEEEEMAHRRLHRKPLESVDECLAALIESLQNYRLSLNTELADLRKDFQRHALENILYDKQHDRALLKPSSESPPSENDKQALLQAFRDVGLVDRAMEQRINEHFAAAKDALSRLSQNPNKIDFETLFIIPLISRTRAIVAFAQELEIKREKLFSSLHSFEEIVNSFLNEKSVDVSDRGELVVVPHKPQRGPIDWRLLSSGEKQILILLTQALLSERSPVVYVADEPELSLHVSWQEKLLGALTKLAGRCQFVVATHSPDIAAGFGSKIIDLAKF